MRRRFRPLLNAFLVAALAAFVAGPAAVQAANPPFITIAFSPATIPLGGTSELTFTIINGETNGNLSGIAVTDTLPAGLSVVNGSTSVCYGGTLTTTGGNTITLTGGSLLDGYQCPPFSVTVTATAPGSYVNVTGPVTSIEGGTGGTATANLDVVAPPTISKAFGVPALAHGDSTSLTFTITNPNPGISLSGVAFTDFFPAGLVVGTPNGLTGDCGGGTVTASPGAASVSLGGGSIPAAEDCTFAVSVTGASEGVKVNTTGPVTSLESGPGGTATASITVATPPILSASFVPSSIPVNGSSQLSFGLTNPETASADFHGLAFSAVLPAGLTATNGSTVDGCTGGTVTVSGGNTITFSGGTLPVGWGCGFGVTVGGPPAGGSYTVTTSQVTAQGGVPGDPASATLDVLVAPILGMAFNPATIGLGSQGSLDFTITNPASNTAAINGAAVTELLPAGLTVADAVTGACGGVLTTSGGDTIALTGAMVDVASPCTFSVPVTGAVAGGYSTTSGPIGSANAGTGNAATATVVVVAPPTIAKWFDAPGVGRGSATGLNFTITNPNPATALTGVAFSDVFPAGLVVSTPNGLTGDCGGGTITALPGTVSVSLSGGAIPAAGSCTFAVSVTGAAQGTQVNVTGSVTAAESGPGGTATASIVVALPPSLSASFAPASIPLNGTSQLTFTIFNDENNPALNGLAFTDTLPAGLTVADSSASACGGTLTTSGGHTIALTGGSLAPVFQCSFAVTVTGAAAGTYANTTGAITSSNGGTGNTATANLRVVAPPVIAKAFGSPTLPHGNSTSLTFTISNPNPTVALTGVGFTDAFPGGLVVSYPNGLSGGCGGGTIDAPPSGSTVTLAGATLPAAGSCTFSVSVTGAAQGVQVNTTGNVTSVEGGDGNTATATVMVATPSVISMAFVPPTIPVNGTTTLAFSLVNPETASDDLAGLAFTATLPAGLTVADGTVTDACSGGTLTMSGGDTITFAGGALPVGWVCTFAVAVGGPAAGGAYTATTGPLTSDEGIPGPPASATLDVLVAPALEMAFDPGTITLGGHASLDFTITNPAANTAAITGAAVTDTLPAGLTLADGTTGACGGTVATSGGNTVTLAGATIAAGSACAFSVDVTGAVAGSYSTTSGPVSSANAGTGNTATASVVVTAVAPTPGPTNQATPPPTSTAGDDAPAGFDPALGWLLLLALAAGCVAVGRAGVRRSSPGRQ